MTRFYHCLFRDNEARHYGAAIRNTSARVEVVNCVFHDNIAHGAGGAALRRGDSAR